MKEKTKKSVVSILFILGVYALSFILGYIIFIFLSNQHELVRLYLSLLGVTVIIYFIGLIFDKTSLINPLWSLSTPVLMIFLMVYYNAFQLGSLLYFIVFTLWAIRLTVNYFYVSRDLSYEDWRYEYFKKKTKKWYFLVSFLAFHLMPVSLVYAASIPMYMYILEEQVFGFLQIIGLFVIISAAVLESLADSLMHKHNIQKQKENELYHKSVWKYCRHPNYLGEILLWFGVLFVYISANPTRWYTMFGAFGILFLHLFISIPLAERHYKETIEDYDYYQKTTFALLPIPRIRRKTAYDVIMERRSVRKFKDKEIPQNKVDDLLRAFYSAPSACNRQPGEVFVVTNKDVIKSLREASKFSNYDSPLVLIVCANKHRLIHKAPLFFLEDTSAGIENILLMAEHLNLGAVWCGIYPVEDFMKNVASILNLEDDLIPVALLHVGYKEEDWVKSRVVDIETKTHYIK